MKRASTRPDARRRTFLGAAAASVIAGLSGIPLLRTLVPATRRPDDGQTEERVMIRIHPLAIPRNKKGADLNG